MSKKEKLAKIIDSVTPDKVYTYLSKMTGVNSKLTILAYHRIMDINEDYPYDIELISGSCKQFEMQMCYLRQHCNPVSIEQVVDASRNRKVLPDNSVLVTFDDGFKDNYTNAYPIMKKYDIPGIIFVSTDYISADNTLWFDRISYLILNASDNEIEKILSEDIKITEKYSDRKELLEYVMHYFKHIKNDLRLKILDKLFRVYASVFKDKDSKLSSTLSWDNVREMNSGGISFGSHTLSHPILSQLTDSEIQIELIESKEKLEKELSTKIETIAYPVGTKSAFNQSVLQYAEKSGYALGFSYIDGVNSWPPVDRFSVKRLHIERYTSFAQFKLMLCMSDIFSY